MKNRGDFVKDVFIIGLGSHKRNLNLTGMTDYQKIASPKMENWDDFIVAERGGFEPPIGFILYPLSRRAHSTTLPPLRLNGWGET